MRQAKLARIIDANGRVPNFQRIKECQIRAVAESQHSVCELHKISLTHSTILHGNKFIAQVPFDRDKPISYTEVQKLEPWEGSPLQIIKYHDTRNLDRVRSGV